VLDLLLAKEKRREDSFPKLEEIATQSSLPQTVGFEEVGRGSKKNYFM
jgi:hypothetical protein